MVATFVDGLVHGGLSGWQCEDSSGDEWRLARGAGRVAKGAKGPPVAQRPTATREQ